MGFRAICKFTDWLVRPRKVYGPQFRFGPYTFLSLTNQSVNLHIALNPMFYLLNSDPQLHCSLEPINFVSIYSTDCLLTKSLSPGH